jgi:hypothetical protein
MSPGEQGIPGGGEGNQRKKSNGVESANSHLLTREENAVAIRLLGPRCQSLGTAVVQIYQSEPQSNHNRWNKRSCGVVCFVKDNSRRYELLRKLIFINWQRKKNIAH